MSSPSGIEVYNYPSRFLFLISLLISLFVCIEGSFSVIVHPQSSKCYDVKLSEKESSQFSGNFEMVNEGASALPLSFTVTRMGENEVDEYNSTGNESGRFQLTSRGGRYKVCIGNGTRQTADRIARKVAFNMRVKPAYEKHPDDPGPYDETLTKIEDLADDLLISLEEVLDHVEVMKERERMHRNISESTFTNVWIWTIFEKFLLVLVSVGQIVYIQQYFRLKRGY